MAPLRLTAVLFVVSVTTAFAQTPAEPPSVIVSGEGVVTAVPDQAWVRIGAESRAKIAKDAQARNAEAMTAVQQKMTTLGIPKDAVRTLAIDLQMEYDYANGKQTPRGYVARNTIEVRVDDFAKLGDVLDAAVGSGATNLHGLRFDVKRREALEREALQMAVANALGRAEALAAGARRSLDRVLRIEESSVSRGGEIPVMAMRMKAGRRRHAGRCGRARDSRAGQVNGVAEVASALRRTVSVRIRTRRVGDGNFHHYREQQRVDLVAPTRDRRNELMDGIKLPPAVDAAIRAHGRETFPHECCGALLGRDGVVQEAHALANTTEEGPRRRFLVRPDDYRGAEQRARDTGLELLGFYHSHPDHPARPSQYDLDHAWPSFSYVIVSIMAGEDKLLTSWRLKADRSAFDEEPVGTTE